MIEPARIIEEGDGSISIEWSDSMEAHYEPRALRIACPCAGCVNEWTGEKMLKEDAVAEDITFSHVSVVGRYALNFHFSDGHDTGIFSFKYLRELAKA
jgi:DUF971 family protein